MANVLSTSNAIVPFDAFKATADIFEVFPERKWILYHKMLSVLTA